MATIVKRGDKIRAIVRMLGQTKTATFDNNTEGRKGARDWALQQEAGILKGCALKFGVSIGATLERVRELELMKPYRSSAASDLPCVIRDFGDMDLAKCTADWWVKMVSAWKCAPASRLCKLMRVTGALRRAERKFGVGVRWDELKRAQGILMEEGLIGKGKARERRFSAEELKDIKAQIGVATKSPMPLADLIDFALATGMRIGEITRVTWADLNSVKGHPMLWVRNRKDPKHKMGNDQNIPLLGDSAAIVKRQPKTDGRIFPVMPEMVRRAFQACLLGAGIKDARFHDLRHEAISRLFEAGYSIPEVCKVSGHKSWASLQIYTNLSGADLHKGPASRRAA